MAQTTHDGAAPEPAGVFDKGTAARPDESWAARLYIRPLSLPLTRLLLKTNITPNQVTIVFILVMLAGALCQLEQRVRWVPISGALLLQLGIILDACDGSIARAKKLYSVKGLYLDMIGHRLVHATLFCAAGAGLYLRDGAVMPLLLAMAATYGELGLTMIFYAKWRALVSYPELLKAEVDRVHAAPPADKRRLVAGYAGASRSAFARVGRVVLGTDYISILLLLVLAASLLDRASWLLWGYAVLQLGRTVWQLGERMLLPFTPDLPKT
jgi:phosphatidylglycerophosphate synthase